MSTVVVGFALVVSAFLQATVFHSTAAAQVMPNLVLVIVLMWSAVRGVAEGLAWALAVGILLDVLGLDSLGANALALLPAVLLGGLWGQRFFHSGLIIPVVATALATILQAVILLLVRSAGGDAVPIDAVGRIIILQVLLNVFIVPPVYLIAGLGRRPVSLRHA